MQTQTFMVHIYSRTYMGVHTYIHARTQARTHEHVCRDGSPRVHVCDVRVHVRCTRLQPMGTDVYMQTHMYTHIVTHKLPAPRSFSAKGFVPGAGLQPQPGPSCHPWQRPARQKPRLPQFQASGCPSTIGERETEQQKPQREPQCL